MNINKNYIATIAYFLFEDAEKPEWSPSIHYGKHMKLDTAQKNIFDERTINRRSFSELEIKLGMTKAKIEEIGIEAIDILFSKNDTFLNDEQTQADNDTKKTMCNVR